MMNINKLQERKFDLGFSALIAILLLSSGALATALAVMSGAISFADSVRSREVRIQNRLNEAACKDTLQLMAQKDYFLDGEVEVPEFGCVARVSNEYNGNIEVGAVEVNLNK